MSRRPYLVFSSIGDSYDAALERWTRDPWGRRERDYDIALVYYGDSAVRYAELAARADRIFWRKGSKFQNLVAHIDAVAAFDYRYVWIVDDDIALCPKAITRLFRITEGYQLAASQPAFSRRGRTSYPLTLARDPWTLLRYTDFVEVTCPVLSRDALATLVAIIRPHLDLLTCWGIDILLGHHVCRPDSGFAVIDAVIVRNPYEREKRGGKRECEQIDDIDNLRDRWLAVRERMRNVPPADAQINELGIVRRWPFGTHRRRVPSV